MVETRDDGAVPRRLLVGLDVGSAMVKAVVVDPETDALLWSTYQRHGARPHACCLDALEQIEAAFRDTPRSDVHVFATGAGGAAVGSLIGAGALQEVHAVALAVKRRCPEANTVIELGGEDSKILTFVRDPGSGLRRKSAAMNDKCAGGTGAVIDKISARLGVAPEVVGSIRYTGVRTHPVAAKCGVFAETDVIGLQKQGVPPEEILASLIEAIVRQNLSVLACGKALEPPVLLLGGPHAFVPALTDCWRRHLPRLWEERRVAVPRDCSIEEMIRVPEHALLFGAFGAIEYGEMETARNPEAGAYEGTDRLRSCPEIRGSQGRAALSDGKRRLSGLVKSAADFHAFKQAYGSPARTNPPLKGGRCRTTSRDFRPNALSPYPSGARIEGFLGVDGGSTSTKAVIIDRDGQLVAKAYRLSAGNPISDVQEVLGDLQRTLRDRRCLVHILGAATTGYAKDVLKDALAADCAVVETVAHMLSGLHSHPEADVICDVGGQDIKIILLKNGVVQDFRLNTQCCAGNGYYLQAAAQALGVPVEKYAEAAFSATAMPEFGQGCAVFLQSDIVGAQQQGWQPNEILAGLAAVLPKNIWLHVCQMPHLARLGRTFILQGGVQRNLAAVKAQVDFIRERFHGTGIAPRIFVHEHSAESGAIGCALEARRRYVEHPCRTAFIGIDAARTLRFTSRCDEGTRCRTCANRCLRTFIDIEIGPGHRRITVANCDKGAAESTAVRPRAATPGREMLEFPDLTAVAAREVFEPVQVDLVTDATPRRFSVLGRARRARMLRRASLRIGMPRVLNLFDAAPIFLGYFQSLGVPARRIVWSDYSSEAMFREGSTRGCIDPCFPAKLALAHVHNLVFRKHNEQDPLTHIFFPIMDALPTWLEGVQASRTCPAAAAAVEAVHAAFTKDGDAFAERGIRFKRTFVDLNQPALTARQLYRDWAADLGVTEAESRWALRQGLRALDRYLAARRGEAREVLRRLEHERRLGIVLLGRPYHVDPAINHGICAQLQRRGYPIFTVESLPLDEDVLEPLFREDTAAGDVCASRSIADVWGNAYAEHSSRKLWAAKYVARHPNLVAIELSSFRCGLDAATYAVLEEILSRSGMPLFYLRDLDESRPAASLKLRIDTIVHFLEQHGKRVLASPESPLPPHAIASQRRKDAPGVASLAAGVL